VGVGQKGGRQRKEGKTQGISLGEPSWVHSVFQTGKKRFHREGGGEGNCFLGGVVLGQVNTGGSVGGKGVKGTSIVHEKEKNQTGWAR